MALSTGYDGGVVLYRIGADSLAVADHFQMQEQSGEAIFGRSDSEVVAGSFGFLNTLLRFHVDVEAGKFEVMQSMDLHQSGIGALEWSHSGDYLISGAHDHSTYIFEPVADDSELQLASSQEDKGDGVHSARWSPDDRFVAQTSSKRDLLQVLEVLPCR
jgi:WD40 repeat protein